MMKHLKSIIGTVAILFSIQPLASWALNNASKTEKAATSKQKPNGSSADKIILEKSKDGGKTEKRHGPDCPTEV